ncbi:MAG: deoxyribodipyrimidine photo-lyase [Gammaproteobacteria bacterium]|jgi:deoxyribodipyrimidine photo-lyase
MIKQDTIIHWFRQDLRLRDNPALLAATRAGKVLPVYILDDENAAEHRLGAASRWWLHHSLSSLNQSLKSNLRVFKGDAETILGQLIDELGISAVYWNRCYEPWRIKRDKNIKERLTKKDIRVETFNGSLLWEPWQLLKKDATPYRVFTPFYRNGCLAQPAPREPQLEPETLNLLNIGKNSCTIESLELLPAIAWDKQLQTHWTIGEDAAHDRLATFLEDGIRHYKEGRDLPAQPFVSRLSPSLHFGELSPNQVWYAARGCGDDRNIEHFCSELGWREFAHSLLYYFPDLPSKNLQVKFNAFPWRKDDKSLVAWQKGLTGYPIVDAGMRELWQTGLMHNRVRMIAGSFLVKNLLLHWQHGERWFWDCLVDADLANNSAGWQWIAGCGADAAPYFRIFNPVIQGEKFDKDGEYTRRFVPELAKLPNKYLFSPWLAPEQVLEEANVKLGNNYPHAIVDLKFSRERALNAFQSTRKPTLST